MKDMRGDWVDGFMSFMFLLSKFRASKKAPSLPRLIALKPDQD
jgi:hypothetical protein